MGGNYPMERRRHIRRKSDRSVVRVIWLLELIGLLTFGQILDTLHVIRAESLSGFASSYTVHLAQYLVIVGPWTAAIMLAFIFGIFSERMGCEQTARWVLSGAHGFTALSCVCLAIFMGLGTHSATVAAWAMLFVASWNGAAAWLRWQLSGPFDAGLS